VKNPSVVGPNDGFESLSASFPKFEFKIFRNLTFQGTALVLLIPEDY